MFHTCQENGCLNRVVIGKGSGFHCREHFRKNMWDNKEKTDDTKEVEEERRPLPPPPTPTNNVSQLTQKAKKQPPVPPKKQKVKVGKSGKHPHPKFASRVSKQDVTM